MYGIVKQSGGHIWVESQVGQGASFNVSLPVVDPGVALAMTDDTAKDVARHGSETILLVEDNDSVRGLARETLERSGYRVLEARNGEQALDLAAKHLSSIALVLTDIVMPVMGGRDLAARLSSWRPGLKIVFTSGYTEDAVARQGVPDQAGVFLQKPFTPAALGKVVRDVLDAPGGRRSG